MSMDAINQVAQQEEAARALRQKAQQQAQELVEQARAEGQAQADAARRAAMARVRDLLAEGEVRDAKATEEALAEYRTQCDALKTQATTHLPEAAKLIVGKVVRD